MISSHNTDIQLLSRGAGLSSAAFDDSCTAGGYVYLDGSFHLVGINTIGASAQGGLHFGDPVQMLAAHLHAYAHRMTPFSHRVGTCVPKVYV